MWTSVQLTREHTEVFLSPLSASPPCITLCSLSWQKNQAQPDCERGKVVQLLAVYVHLGLHQLYGTRSVDRRPVCHLRCQGPCWYVTRVVHHQVSLSVHSPNCYPAVDISDGNMQPLYLIVLMAMYGLALLPNMYCMQFLFTGPAAGYVAITFFNLLTGTTIVTKHVLLPVVI